MTKNVQVAWSDSPPTYNAALRSLNKEHGVIKHGVERPELASSAAKCAQWMALVPNVRASEQFSQRLNLLTGRMRSLSLAAQRRTATGVPSAGVHSNGMHSDEVRWLRENLDYLRSELATLDGSKDAMARTVHVRCPDRGIVPRVLVIAGDLLTALDYRFDEISLNVYLTAFQSTVILRLGEFWNIVPALKLVLLEHIVELALPKLVDAETRANILGTGDSTASDMNPANGTGIKNSVQSLREIQQTPWEELLEPHIIFDRVLRQDPAGAYPRMDRESREMYRNVVAKLSDYSDYSELEIAELALALARRPVGERTADSRVTLRRSHVGFYLVAEGRELLYRRANVRLPFRDRVQEFLRRHPDDFYPLGIESLTATMILALLWWVNFSSPWNALFCAVVLLIPCSQSAVEIMNYLTTFLLDPQPLPKLDFAGGIPEECSTMVVVPTLLLHEKQVRQLVRDLEVRYVGNMSANLHFALLTDLPDSAEQPREDDPLVELCGTLVRELNQKYARDGAGTFAMFHRHRTYNRSENVWMGFERKRGKLHDFNQLILGIYDSFPYKVGELSILRRIRYVLTLDSDTELPRQSARKLIGAMAHPLCQAIIDRDKNVVTQGYGILQPRVGVSVQSAAQSRLASLYSGRTGLDIYTRAISDVYQDLYGEGTFVGKGLYEVRTMHQVLDGRFPRNAILSHDLIEGAYTRAGLVTDVEVIDRYPSHYSAYVRRKHRWVRGDWQIWEWLFPRVPDESLRRVPNPISLISRWKILDNLRRSMVEPATLALFLLAWTVLPGQALHWTLVALAVLFAPAIFQFLARLARTAIAGSISAVKDACVSLATGVAGVVLSIAFLLHDALVAADAIWHSVYRRGISGKRLLEWETAAQAEGVKSNRSRLDLYLLFTPVSALGIGIALALTRPGALMVALPFLVLWAASKPISLWLDRPLRQGHEPPARADKLFLRQAALRTWRYFAEFSTEEHHWLIPDNVQGDPPQLAARVSPTNLGLLLNARQVACELGYLTVPEFVEQTRRTLETMNSLRSHRGHLLNWYDTRTLAAPGPWFVSSVDSGNLAASLVALSHGCKALLDKPLLSPALLEGHDDLLRALASLKALSPKTLRRFSIRAKIKRRGDTPDDSFSQRLLARISAPVTASDLRSCGTQAEWYACQLLARTAWMATVLSDYMPWLLPEFDDLRRSLGIESHHSGVQLSPAKLPAFIEELEDSLRNGAVRRSEHDRRQCARLLALLKDAHERSIDLARELDMIANDADLWFSRMDFSFLLNTRRKLLSIGYNVDAGLLHAACYDLLASESRVATFIAIAKGDVPPEVWFSLGRKLLSAGGGKVLGSWTGTMFEYLMPAIWMTSYPDTLLHRSMEAAVKEQQTYAAEKGIPWGASESGFCELDESGSYGYRAFGVPRLALQSEEAERVVVAPYASTISLLVAPEDALRNLRRMEKLGWFGKFGFYEAADFGPVEIFRRGSWRLVKSWMAHHQGMSLLSMANFLSGDIVRQWFHDDVRVQATELLLQERPPGHQTDSVPRVRAAASSRSSAGPTRGFALERKAA
jgi:cyclic beta-1,2-glucan synthetase